MLNLRSLLRSTPLRVVAAVGVGVAGVVTAATLAAATPNGDPVGANGTVKIDGFEFDSGNDNEPHVTCPFQVKFFNFDEDQHANIIFTLHSPTGKDIELLSLNNQLISDDEAGGTGNDLDEVITFTSDDLGLGGYTPHPQQGFHVKLTIELIDQPGAGKHKVFWLEPCGTPSPTPTPTETSPSPSPSDP